MTDTYLLLIRHGQTEWNRDHRIQGNGDSVLTALGHAQATAAASTLQRFPIDAFYASDAGRALQTATPIAALLGREPELDPRLRERHFGIFEGKTQQEIRDAYPDAFEAYQKRHPDFAVPGGESIAEVQARGVAACTAIASRHRGQHIVVVSHGGTIRAIARYVLDVPLVTKWRVRLENGGLTIIRYNDSYADPWWLITLNEVAHLDNLPDWETPAGWKRVTNTQFFLVRHGQTVWNSLGRIQGSQDSPLTPQGIADASAVAARLMDEAFSAVYTSDLTRAYRTARFIAEVSDVALVSDDRLRETNNGIFEGKRREEAAEEFPALFAEYARRLPDYALPGGESRRSVQNRALDFFNEKAKERPGQRIVAVSHGGLLSAFVCAILGLPLSGSRTFWLSNGGLSLVTHLADEGGRWRIETLNETRHLRTVASKRPDSLSTSS